MYSISDLERISGVKPHTLRVWERRYGLFIPERSDGNHRLYNDDHVILLLRVKRLLERGWRISAIAALSKEQLEEELGKDGLVDTHINDSSEEFIVMALHYDETRFENLFTRLEARMSFEDIWRCHFVPGLDRIGKLWLMRKVLPAQEHFISCLIRRKVIAKIDELPFVDCNRTDFILFLPAGEHHELGLLMSFYLLKKKGFKCIYLGQDVPEVNLDRLVQSHLDAILLTFIHGMKMKPSFVKQLQNLSEQGIQIVLNGQLESGDNAIIQNEAKMTNFATFDSFLEYILSLQSEMSN